MDATMIPIDGDYLDMPGVSRHFGLPGAEALEGQESIVPVCASLQALGELVRPLSFWFLVEKAAEQELGLRPGTTSPEIRRVEVVNPEAVAALMAEALAAESQDPEVVIGWDEVLSDATEVKLPTSLARKDVLTIGPEGYSFGVPVRHRPDGAWIRGPRSVGELPALQLAFNRPFVRARLTSYWSIWTPEGSGAHDLDQASSQLAKLGWKQRR
jgi:hypothetical protein